jgi:hypothetical protein
METYLFSIKRSQEALLIFILLHGALLLILSKREREREGNNAMGEETGEDSSCTLNSLWERWERRERINIASERKDDSRALMNKTVSYSK